MTRCYHLLLIPFFLLITPTVFSQSLLPGGDFEQWELYDLYEEFPPFGSNNTLSYILTGESNLTSVPGCEGGQGLRMETVATDSGTLTGAIVVGNFGASASGGIPYSEQPDSLKLCLRYDVPVGDTAVLLMVFTANGSLVAQGTYLEFVGTELNWTELELDLPSFIGVPDSVAIVVVSSWFDDTPPIAGSWLELDNWRFTGVNNQLPNSDFETSDTLKYNNPLSWASPNPHIIALGGTEAVTQSADSYNGNYAVKIETIEVSTGGSLDTTGFIGNDFELGSEGQPYNNPNLVSCLNGWYKYIPVGQDTAGAYIAFSRYNAVTGETDVIFDEGITLPPASEYTPFSIPISLTGQPDSFFVAFVSSAAQEGFAMSTTGIGSALWLDDVGFCWLTPLEELTELPEVNFYPNPTRNQVNISFSAIPGESYRLELFDSRGQSIRHETLPETWASDTYTHSIDLSTYVSGMYFLSLRNSQGDLLKTEKIWLVQ